MLNYLKCMFYTLITILIISIILTLFNYFNVLNGIVLKIVMLLTPIIGIFIGGFKVGNVSNNKGYIEGLKYGIIWITLIFFINLLIKNIDITCIIYYCILLLMSVIAGVIGINRKKV